MFFKYLKNKPVEIFQHLLGSFLNFVLAVSKQHREFGWKGHLLKQSMSIEISILREGENDCKLLQLKRRYWVTDALGQV